MQVHTSLLIAGAALAMGGCGSSPAPSSSAASGAPRPAAALAPAAAASCVMATQSVNTCREKGTGARKRLVCELFVGGSPDQPFVYPYNLDMSLTDKTLPVTLVWKLLDRRYRFPDANGGPTKPGNSPNFTDGNTADDDDGESDSGGPERRYRWRFTQPNSSTLYKYDVRFEVPDPLDSTKWVAVTCDPTIRSSGN